MHGTEAFTHIVEKVPLDIIAVALRAQYGIECLAVEQLSGERDQNYRVTDQSGTVYVCKVSHPFEEVRITESQTRVLRHLAHVAPGLPVQRVVPTVKGDDFASAEIGHNEPVRVRLLTYLQGTPMHQSTASVRTRCSLGATHAQLITALSTLTEVETTADLLWDLSHIQRVRPMLKHLRSDSDHQLAERSLHQVEQCALPYVTRLRQQLIHNDLNPYNLLIEGNTLLVCGILDFGDLVVAPLLNDIAIASSYLISPHGHPLDDVCDYVAAFHHEFPLLPEEIDLLFLLIVGRLVMTVAITEWRAKLHPENRNYILRNNPAAWLGLRRLSAVSVEEARARFLCACGMVK
jgi:Ser/Thr protein kinase RdoA (MazF antagonist)